MAKPSRLGRPGPLGLLDRRLYGNVKVTLELLRCLIYGHKTVLFDVGVRVVTLG